MNPSEPKKTRRRGAAPQAEALETRQLLTGGAGDTFAILPGEVTKAGQPVVMKFSIDSAHFTMPKRGSLQLGVDVATSTSTTLQARVRSVETTTPGATRSALTHAQYDPSVQRTNTAAGSETSAALTRVGLAALSPGHKADYSVKVTGQNGSTGKFLLGFYLPGDANGDGTVDQADVKLVQADMGTKASSTKYSFEADANRDGRINSTDMRITKQNLGAHTTVTPVVSANLDPASDSGIQDRVTTVQDAKFTGTATPNAAVKFDETAGKTAPMATTADAKGNYTLIIPLAQGSNTFKVTTQDPFGQSITGTINPVTYMPSQSTGMTTFNALKEQANVSNA